jgi:hypothetical protein
MNLQQRILRLGLAALLLVGLGACTVVPTYPVGYQHRPAYVETYPAYGYPGTTIYYQSGPRYFDSYGIAIITGAALRPPPARCHAAAAADAPAPRHPAQPGPAATAGLSLIEDLPGESG